MIKEKIGMIALAAVTGTFLSLYAQDNRRPVTYIEPELPVIVRASELAHKEQEEAAEELPPAVIELETEAWHGTDRKLTEYEWDILGHLVMAEARGESFEVQYMVACVVLNRVDNPLFPNTVAGVIYQTKPIQFSGAWDTTDYEVSDSVWEAIQEALISNELPEDVLYFTSEGYLPGTEEWKQVGNMWFSRQEGL